MGEIYTIVITVLLLFPWSLVALMVGGAAVTKARKAASARRRWPRSVPASLGLTGLCVHRHTTRSALPAPLPR